MSSGLRETGIHHHVPADSLAVGRDQTEGNAPGAAARRGCIRRWDPRWASGLEVGAPGDDRRSGEEGEGAGEEAREGARARGREGVNGSVDEGRNERGPGRCRWRAKPSPTRRPTRRRLRVESSRVRYRGGIDPPRCETSLTVVVRARPERWKPYVMVWRSRGVSRRREDKGGQGNGAKGVQKVDR